MLFVTPKSKQTNNFNLKEISAAVALRRRPAIETWHKLLCAVVLGLLLALSAPGFDQWWLGWFMVTPFLVLLRYCSGNRESLACGLLFGLGYHLLALRSYLGIASAAAPGSLPLGWELSLLIWFVQAFELSLPTMAFAWLINSLPLRPGYLPYFKRPFFPYLIAVPLLWVFLNWGLNIAHSLTAIWQLVPLPPMDIDGLAYSQYSQLQIIQIARYIGPAGIEFLLLLVNAAIAAVCVELVNVQERPVERVDLVSPRLGALIDFGVAVAIVGLVYFFGNVNLSRLIFAAIDPADKDYLTSEISQPNVPVALFSLGSDSVYIAPQGNTRAGEFIFNESLYARSLNESGKYFGIAVLAEPDREIDFDRVNGIFGSIKKTTRHNANSVITSFISGQKGDLIRHNLIFAPSGSYTGQQRLTNSVGYFLARLNSILNVGDNQFEQSLSWLFSSMPSALKEWFCSLDNSDGSSSPRTAPDIVKLNWGNCALLGISEITNPRLVSNQVRSGASLLVFSTNISWTHYQCLSKQLIALAIFRAVENNRYLLLCTNSGVLAIIEPTGAVQALSLSQFDNRKLSQAAYPSLILGTVQFLWSKTPFTKMWWF